jgi:small-conductance mechanosensitive channel
MIRRYALGHLIAPAIMLTVGWYLVHTGDFDGVEFLAFLGTPAAVLVLAWAAVVANDIANRRSERHPQQVRSTRFLFYYPLAPAFYLLVGGGALWAGYINEAYFLAAAGAPAAVLTLAWLAVLANEVANRRSARRKRNQ